MSASLHANRAIRAIFFAALSGALLAALLSAGCVHRIELRQGDLRVVQNADKLTQGMSESEVEELLGEPQTQSPFRDGHWIYLYKKRQPGFFGKTGQYVLKVTFEDKRVRDVQILESGELPEFANAENEGDEGAEGDEGVEGDDEESDEGDDEDSDSDSDSDSESDSDSDKGDSA